MKLDEVLLHSGLHSQGKTVVLFEWFIHADLKIDLIMYHMCLVCLHLIILNLSCLSLLEKNVLLTCCELLNKHITRNSLNRLNSYLPKVGMSLSLSV